MGWRFFSGLDLPFLPTVTTGKRPSYTVVMPLSSTVSGSTGGMPLHSFCLDVVHWISYVYPRADPYRWPVGKISASVTVNEIVSSGQKTRGRKRAASALDSKNTPPSLRRRLNDVLNVTNSPAWQTNLPSVRAHDDLDSLVPIWASVLAKLEQPARCEPVPVSLSHHEDRMLEYGRDVPLCALGDEACAALQVPGNQGPLNIYVMPSVQALLDQGLPPPAPFSPDATCLLCIRRDVHAAVLAWNALVPNPSVAINRCACVPPPFSNLVDVPGGYIRQAMAQAHDDDGKPGTNVFGPVSIVGCHAQLQARVNPETQRFYIDQSSIKVPCPSFLCPGTTACT